MILAPTYHFSPVAICSIFFHVCLVFKQNTIFLSLLPAVRCLRGREEKRREEKRREQAPGYNIQFGNYNVLFTKSVFPP